MTIPNAQTVSQPGANPIDLANSPEVRTFKMRIPLVEKGSYRLPLASTENAALLLRVYAPHGGENAMHAHHNQDHSFIVLQGQARFTTGRNGVSLLGKNEGIMIPAGGYYCFENAGEEPLVVLRIGIWCGEGDPAVRLGVHGEQIDPHTPANNRPLDVVFKEGAFFE